MRNVMLVLFALLLVASVSHAQGVYTATGPWIASITNQMLVEVGEGDISGLAPGATYTLNPQDGVDPVVTPNTGNEDGTAMTIDVTTNPGAAFELTFNLPTQLIGDVQSVGCFFGPQSLYRVDNGGLLNPNVPNVISTGIAGEAHFLLGISVVVPKDALEGDYTGDEVSANFASGLSKNKRRIGGCYCLL